MNTTLVSLLLGVLFLGGTVNVHSAALGENNSPVTEIVPDLEEFLRKSFEFLYKDDLRGLFDYVEQVPNWKSLISWLKLNHPDANKAIECLFFGSCEDGGVVIDPVQVQRILVYIASSDWEGLSNYVCSQPNLEIVVMWIKMNYPNAYAAIADKIDDCKKS